jgi:hypothetical protein
MERLIIKLKKLRVKIRKLRRRKAHLSYMRTTLVEMKYDILNDALKGNINTCKVKLFHKYQKRYYLITFLQ